MNFEQSILHSTLEVELYDCIDGLRSDKENIGTYVYPIEEEFSIDFTDIGDIEREYHDSDDEDSDSDAYLYGVDLVNDLFGENELVDPHKALKIEGSMTMIINMLKEILKEPDTLRFYGLLLSDGKGNVINPANPIVAREIKKSLIPLDTYKMLLYPMAYPITINTDTVKKWREEWECLIEHIDKHSFNIEVSSLDKNSVYNEVISNTSSFKDRMNYDISSDNTKVKYLVTPIQAINLQGINMPYYGAIQSFPEYGESKNIFPCMTGNINIESDIYEAEDYLENKYVGTCIGDYSNNEAINYHHMNIMNANSLYSEKILAREHMECARAAIELSYKILTGEYYEQI